MSRIAAQAERLFICDNSDTSNEDMFQNIQNAVYLFWGENKGISGAFNRVLKDSSFGWRNDDFIIFFDQDSDIPDMHIARLINEYRNLLSMGQHVGCLGPVYYNRSNDITEIAHMRRRVKVHDYRVNSIITSSMLCRYCDIKKIDFWNEEIFLDWSDFDLCWRLRKIGKYCYVTDKAVLNHMVGSGEKKFGIVRLRVWPPVRDYYQTRDCLKLMTKGYVPLKFKIRTCISLTFGVVAKVILLDSPKERLEYMKKGICDYCRRLNGRIS